MTINYRQFIEDNFLIKDKLGNVVPFVLNPTQAYYYELVDHEYPDWQGIRENILKFRQPGFSSLIDAIFMVDFIFSEAGEIPIIDSDIYSHKDSETKVLFERASFFLDCFLERRGVDPFLSSPIERKKFLEYDNNNLMKGRKGAQIHVQTANAKVSGRGGTKQNIHWSECGFYPNTEILSASDLVLGAEQQVLDGYGKIFRESTGNMVGDFFNEEYDHGKESGANFKSRFLGWWIHPDYSRTPPDGWFPPQEYDELRKQHDVPLEQIYWHWNKINSEKPDKRDKMRREYPTTDIEAFMSQGSLYFDVEALRKYKFAVKAPIEEQQFHVA